MDEGKLDKMRSDIDDLRRQLQEIWQRIHAISEMLEDRGQH